MASVVLTIIDTVSIQSYIFGSNRLRENIGASYLVEQATRNWVYAVLPTPNNLKPGEMGAIDSDKEIEKDDLACELVYAGGGNTVILFRSPDIAKSFARELSRKVLTEAPGLEIVISHSDPFDWSPTDHDSLHNQVRQLIDGRLNRKVRSRQATSTHLLGLGVTAECSSTGLVASMMTDARLEPPPTRMVSKEVYAKLEAARPANDRLTDLVRQHDPGKELAGFQFTNELDRLGRTGGTESYIAVVHLDGNDMRKLIEKRAALAPDNRGYIAQMRAFSKGVERAGSEALVSALRALRRQMRRDQDGWFVEESVPQVALEPYQHKVSQQKIRLFKDEQGTFYWPFRPLVFGGDDVTFVCNGQLGLSLAAIYMREFARQSEKALQTTIQTGAGVCVVKVHYPFQRAYNVAEDLTRKAKESLGNDKPSHSAIDWHFSTTGLSGKLDHIRQREYTTQAGTLLMRPVRFTKTTAWRSWGNFNRLVATFNYDARWAGRRNKLKSLREALREGPDSVQEFLRTYRIEALPALPGGPIGLEAKGWDASHCAYFDALEAMDHHFLLEDIT